MDNAKQGALVPAGDVGMSRQEQEFKTIAVAIIADTARVGQKYYDLCIYARRNELTPVQMRQWLTELHFHKGRTSEIIKVACASEEVFSQWAAKLIGFHGVLALARGVVKEVKRLDVPADEAELIESTAKEFDKHPEEKPKARVKGQGSKRQFEKAAVKLLALAVKVKSRGKVWDIGTGYVLTLEKTSAKSSAE